MTSSFTLEKKGFYVQGFVMFLIGISLCYLFIEEFIDKKLPPAFTIERNGKEVGYADTDPSQTEFVYVKNAKSPGMFIAFPIYGDKDMLKEASNG